MIEYLIDLTFVATDKVDLNVLLDEEQLFRTHLKEDEDGYLGLESAVIDSEINLNHMLAFLLGANFSLNEETPGDGKKVVDLTNYKKNCITFEQLEERYHSWVKLTSRQSTMDEYGDLLGVIGYVHRNVAKRFLVVIIEKRKQLA